MSCNMHFLFKIKELILQQEQDGDDAHQPSNEYDEVEPGQMGCQYSIITGGGVVASHASKVTWER